MASASIRSSCSGYSGLDPLPHALIRGTVYFPRHYRSPADPSKSLRLLIMLHLDALLSLVMICERTISESAKSNIWILPV